jgi:hypothetical protein
VHPPRRAEAPASNFQICLTPARVHAILLYERSSLLFFFDSFAPDLRSGHSGGLGRYAPSAQGRRRLGMNNKPLPGFPESGTKTSIEIQLETIFSWVYL